MLSLNTPALRRHQTPEQAAALVGTYDYFKEVLVACPAPLNSGPHWVGTVEDLIADTFRRDRNIDEDRYRKAAADMGISPDVDWGWWSRLPEVLVRNPELLREFSGYDAYIVGHYLLWTPSWFGGTSHLTLRFGGEELDSDAIPVGEDEEPYKEAEQAMLARHNLPADTLVLSHL